MDLELDNNLFGENKESQAIDRFRAFCPPEGYYLAFSGGKDSVVIRDLCDRSGVNYDAHYSFMQIDPPELISFIIHKCPDVEIVRPEVSFFRMMVTRGFPSRFGRWCCEYLKEKASLNRVTVTGVRWDESIRRRKRKMVEVHERHGGVLVNPIIDWTMVDVWNYIHGYDIPYCKLYDEGWNRLGCVLCPMISATQAKKEAERWPRLAEAWKRAFVKLYEYRKSVGAKSINRWENGEKMFEWWMTKGRGNNRPKLECQYGLFQ